jgi:hypothetical protein
MFPCPVCSVVAFDGAVCRACGYQDPNGAAVRIITGQAVPEEAPALELDPTALVPLGAEDGPSLEGFESTSLVEPTRASPAPPPEVDPGSSDVFVYAACPQCQQPQGQPPETFCPHCGYRLKRRVRPKGEAVGVAQVECRDCGTPNPPGRTSCVNCGFRLGGAR